jgi:hypothetical protein
MSKITFPTESFRLASAAIIAYSRLSRPGPDALAPVTIVNGSAYPVVAGELAGAGHADTAHAGDSTSRANDQASS